MDLSGHFEIISHWRFSFLMSFNLDFKAVIFKTFQERGGGGLSSPIIFLCEVNFLPTDVKPSHTVPSLSDCVFLTNLYQCDFFSFHKVPKSKEEVYYEICSFFVCVCVYVSAMNLTAGHRKGSGMVWCCWSPPLPFDCLSDVLLGWAPHSDGVDKMTGGWHTSVNVDLAAKHCFPRSTEALTHQKIKTKSCSLKGKVRPGEMDTYKRKKKKAHGVTYTQMHNYSCDCSVCSVWRCRVNGILALPVWVNCIQNNSQKFCHNKSWVKRSSNQNIQNHLFEWLCVLIVLPEFAHYTDLTCHD